MSVDTPKNYVEAMEKHTENDRKVTEKEVADKERVMNGHSVMFDRMLRIGEKGGQEDRVKQAMTRKVGPVPLRKQYKMVPPDRQSKGPPTRPVCGASSSINGPLSHTLSEVLVRFPDEMDLKINTECRSREEMVAGMEETNRTTRKESVVFSSDVGALYPSMKVEKVSRVTAEEYRKSSLKIEGND